MIPSPEAAEPDLATLLGLFPTDDDFDALEPVSATEVPAPYHGLLVHEHHMTVTVEAFHGDRVDVRVLDRIQDGPYYARRILLALHGSGRIVQYGIVRIDFRLCDPEVAAEIASEKTPLGRVLIEHDVLRRVEPKVYLQATLGPALKKHFGLMESTPGTLSPLGLPEPTRTYGRLATIHCDHQPAVQVLEVVAPVAL